MMLPEDIAKLKRLALAASAGPWQKSGAVSRIDLSHTKCFTVGSDKEGFIMFPTGRTDREYAFAFADSSFVAAANPKAILELIALLEERHAQT